MIDDLLPSQKMSKQPSKHVTKNAIISLTAKHSQSNTPAASHMSISSLKQTQPIKMDKHLEESKRTSFNSP